MYIDKRSSACVPAVTGTHAPGRGEGVAGSRRWSGDVISAVSSCRGCKGQRQCQVVETLTPHITCSGRGRRVGQYLLIVTAVMTQSK